MIIDVSKHQGVIDWNKVAPKLDFCMIKASGLSKDPRYDYNAKECMRLGVAFHAYHYLYSVSETAAKKEAKLFADSVKGTTPLVYVLDMEYPSIQANKARKIAETFETELRRILGNDIRVAVYIGNHLYKSWALNYSRYDYVWIPRYKKNDDGKPTGNKPNFYCDIWQYSSKGKIDGINGYVDLDILAGNKPMEYFTGKTNKNETTTIAVAKSLLGKRLLKKGSKGDDVRELQRGLIEMGYDVGKWGADGDFGGSTKNAVKNFQKKNGLLVDGEFGPASLSVYERLVN